MPRRGPIQPRRLAADPVHASTLVTQLVNRVMRDGKKALAQRIVHQALDAAARRTSMEPAAVLRKAVDNVKPALEVRSRRVGGATYPVPVPVSERRGTALAVRWLVQFARQRRGAPMAAKLAAEIVDAVNNTGSAVKRRDDLHRQAEANRAFAHYRW